ncbi:Dna2/Cas4 domain-containing protein [Candidatus Poribacteria bacterium]|nr:Dna2/Cas4 domain-containing protein [Candidatus Poribacteria bacterium]
MTDQEFEELKVGGMEVNYLIVCPRKLWLYTHDLRMEKLSDKVSLGAFIK